MRDGGKDEIRIDGIGTVAEQDSKMVFFPRVAGFGDEARLHPLAFANKMVMHRADGKGHRHRREFGTDSLIAQHEERLTGFNCRRGAFAQRLQGGF